MKSVFNNMASTLALCLLMLGPIFSQADGLSLPSSDPSDLISPEDRVSDEGHAMAVAERDEIMGAANLNDGNAVQTEARGALYTAEILPTKITELRKKYGVGAVVQENSLVIQAFNSIDVCGSGRVCSMSSLRRLAAFIFGITDHAVVRQRDANVCCGQQLD